MSVKRVRFFGNGRGVVTAGLDVGLISRERDVFTYPWEHMFIYEVPSPLLRG